MSNNHSLELAKFIAESIDEKKGNDIKLIDLKNVADYTDYFVIASADSEIQIRAIANWVKDEVEDNGLKVYRSEGMQTLEWVILDYVDVVVHLFKPEARDKYNLEKMWSDGTVSDYKDGELVPTKWLSVDAVNSINSNIQSKQSTSEDE